MKLEKLNLTEIFEHPVNLRPVNKHLDEYTYLVLSIKERGVLQPILVRPIPRGYQLVKGAHRYEAAKEAGHVWIPCIVMNLTDEQIAEIQIISSVHHIETKPVEYQRQILRLCHMDSSATLTSMAKKLCKSLEWVRNRMNLHRLNAQATELVNRERITLINAHLLTKLLSEEDQLIYLDKALTMSADEFITTIFARVKEVQEAKRAAYRGRTSARPCVAHVSREFFDDKGSDGTEMEFIYEGDPIAESLKGCKTIEDVRVVVQEPPKKGYYWIVTQVQLADRVIV